MPMQPTQPSKPVANAIEQSFGVVPIFKKDNEVWILLIQHNAGHWAFPKGHAELGETELQTARRELLEETGIEDVLIITSPVFEERYRISRKGSWREKTVRYWIGYVRDPNVHPQESEVRDYRWATVAETRALITYPQTQKLFEEVVQHLGWSI